jgi:hypothetical protein
MKHSLRSAVLLVPLLATWAFAGIYYEQEITIPGRTTMPEGFAKVVYVYISGAKMRDEPQGQGVRGPTIVRYDESRMYYLVTNNRTYMEIPIQKRTPDEEAQIKVTVTKTNETKKIGNYNCTRYEVTTKGLEGLPPEGMTTQCWMTTDVDVADEYAKFADAVNRSESSKVAAEMAKVKGFPMQVVITTPDGKEYMTTTVTTVRKQDIPDSMFEVPAGYTKVEAPTPGATPPAAPPAAPAQSGAGAGKGE